MWTAKCLAAMCGRVTWLARLSRLRNRTNALVGPGAIKGDRGLPFIDLLVQTLLPSRIIFKVTNWVTLTITLSLSRPQ